MHALFLLFVVKRIFSRQSISKSETLIDPHIQKKDVEVIQDFSKILK